MAVLLSDDFTRADAAAAVGSPTVGGPYTVRSGVAGISGNQLYFSTANNTGAGSHLTFPAAVDAEVSITHSAGALGSPTAGLILRWADASNMWTFRWNQTTLALSRIVAGGFDQLGSLSYTPSLGDRFSFAAKGRQLYASVNGQLKIEVHDHRYYNPADTIAGVVNTSTSTYRLDALLASDVVLPAIAGGTAGEDYLGADAVETSTHLYKGRDTVTLDEGNEA